MDEEKEECHAVFFCLPVSLGKKKKRKGMGNGCRIDGRRQRRRRVVVMVRKMKQQQAFRLSGKKPLRPKNKGQRKSRLIMVEQDGRARFKVSSIPLFSAYWELERRRRDDEEEEESWGDGGSSKGHAC